MPFIVKKDDLVSMKVDAIVNASNIKLSMVEGVGRAIFHKAGDRELSMCCKKIGHCNVGDAVLTPSFKMENCKGIIHAVGPIYINGKHGEEKNLMSTYNKCLDIALKNDFKTIAFPLLSGEFNYPLKDCYLVAEHSISAFLKKYTDFVAYLIMYKNFPEFFNEEEQQSLTTYIINNQTFNLVNSNKNDFLTLLREDIEKKKISLNELSYKANIREEYLNNILNDSINDIEKNDIISIGVALELNKQELNDLLVSKGFKLEDNFIPDLIVCFYIDSKNYNIFDINRALFKYNYASLGNDR